MEKVKMKMHSNSKRVFKISKITLGLTMATTLIVLLLVESWLYMIVLGSIHYLIDQVPAISYKTAFVLAMIGSYIKMFIKFLKSEVYRVVE